VQGEGGGLRLVYVIGLHAVQVGNNWMSEEFLASAARSSTVTR